MLNIDEIRDALHQRGVLRSVPALLYLAECGSTNEELRHLDHDAPSGTVVIAHRQHAGRGRHQRSWASEPGGIYLSLLLRGGSRESLGTIPLMMSVAVARALTEIVGRQPILKWPNDVYFEGRKCAGVLCESSLQGESLERVIVGVGINANQIFEPSDERTRSAVNLASLLGSELRLPDAIACVLARLFEANAQRGDSQIDTIESFRELSGECVGRRIRVVPTDGEPYLATIQGIARSGGLEIETSGQSKTLFAEDVEYLRPHKRDTL